MINIGRNRELQGLAQAMVKLWERNAIAKIAIKRGVQNTRNERMAEELKVRNYRCCILKFKSKYLSKDLVSLWKEYGNGLSITNMILYALKLTSHHLGIIVSLIKEKRKIM